MALAAQERGVTGKGYYRTKEFCFNKKKNFFDDVGPNTGNWIGAPPEDAGRPGMRRRLRARHAFLGEERVTSPETYVQEGSGGWVAICLSVRSNLQKTLYRCRKLI